jgi:hypothetical protein
MTASHYESLSAGSVRTISSSLHFSVVAAARLSFSLSQLAMTFDIRQSRISKRERRTSSLDSVGFRRLCEAI